MNVPEYKGVLRSHMIEVPEVTRKASGIKIFGRRIKSLVFSTDVAIIKNINADAVIAVYPFTPQPVITQAVMMSADMPVFAGVGGGVTKGERVVSLAVDADYRGAIGVVVNAPTENDIISKVKKSVDIPVVVTVVTLDTDIQGRLEAGADMINVSGAAKTPEIVASIRARFPELAIIATGGRTDADIQRTIDAGANAITWTPPTSAELFRISMDKYRTNHAGEKII